MKHIELFNNGFDSNIDEKIQPENWPYVGHDMVTGEIVYTIVPEENQSGYQMVDLGLPSSLKWADRNVGASSPEDAGLYFSWGNVDGHAVDENGNIVDGYSFDWGNTPYSTVDEYGNPVFSKYNGTDGITVLEAIDDAVTVNMGGDWRMPTVDETLELVQETDHYYIGEDGSIVAGPFNYETNRSDKGLDGSESRSICFVKKGDQFDYNNRSNFIEFPFTGYCSGSLVSGDGSDCYIWSSSINNDIVEFACFLSCDNTGYLYGDSTCPRCLGQSVRGVHA